MCSAHSASLLDSLFAPIAVREALSELFESFMARRLDSGDGLVELDLCLGDTYIEPKLRAGAIAGWEHVYAEDSDRTIERPVSRVVPLALGGEMPTAETMCRAERPTGGVGRNRGVFVRVSRDRRRRVATGLRSDCLRERWRIRAHYGLE